MIAIDTNILLYSVDHNEPEKQLKARLLLQHMKASPEPDMGASRTIGSIELINPFT